jgi:preprotein translocase subunit SecG
MEIIKVLLIIVEVICGLLLVGVILLQKSKSEGLGLAFGSGMGETLFGSRAGNVLTKITVVLAIIFMVTTSLLAAVFTAAHERSIIDTRTAPLPAMPPPQPAAAQQAPAGAAQQPAGPAPTFMPGVALDDVPAPAAPATEPMMMTVPAADEAQP